MVQTLTHTISKEEKEELKDLIDDSTDCSSLAAHKASTKTGRRVYSCESSSGKLLWTITRTVTLSCNKSGKLY